MRDTAQSKTDRVVVKIPGGGMRNYYSPDGDPLFHACLECPYKDCRYHVDRGTECPFRLAWGRKHGVGPAYLGGFKVKRRGDPLFPAQAYKPRRRAGEMGVCKWLWKRLNEPSTWDEEGQRDRDHYVPSGVGRFMGKNMGQVKDRFRDAFGDHYGGDDEDAGDS